MKKPITIILLVMLSARVLHARHMRNFQFWEFGYQWTTDSGNAPGPGSFSPSHVSPLSSGIGLTLTETSSGSIVGGEARTLVVNAGSTCWVARPVQFFSSCPSVLTR
jgi:hypothetical protein